MEDDFNFETISPEEPSNRTFTIVAVALVAIVIITIAGILLWMFVLSPSQQEARDLEATETAAALTQAALAQIPTETFTPRPSNTPPPTFAPTNTIQAPAQVSTETPTVAPTATVRIVPTPTALPDTGFGDDVSLLGLVSLGAVLILIALAARQIRVNLVN
jgi:cytoskeletal protein RodZ